MKICNYANFFNKNCNLRYDQVCNLTLSFTDYKLFAIFPPPPVGAVGLGFLFFLHLEGRLIILREREREIKIRANGPFGLKGKEGE